MERRIFDNGVVLDGCWDGPVRFAFTERTGGVSLPPYASLNLGSHVGDDPAAVAENRRRALASLGAVGLQERLLVPNQVHGDTVVRVAPTDAGDLAHVRERLAAGADAVVCTARDVPVLLCYADCTPVVICAQGGFAVVHSGWRGTYARIAGKAARALAEMTEEDLASFSAYIGPHILGDEYEVSPEVVQMFSLQFDNINPYGARLLDMSRAICQSLEEAGVPRCEIHDPRLSTTRLNERFFSYRKENGICGRHAAVAMLR